MSILTAAVSASKSVLAFVVTPSPTPIDPATTSVGSPGIAGFLVTFIVALAAIGLFLSLTRHLRIVDRRSRQRDEAEAAAADPEIPPGPASGDAAGGA